MRIKYWGVRGFVPTPGPDYLHYGGNTLSVGIEGEDGTIIALDAGTGLSVWGRELLSSSFGQGKGKINLIITHSHYDHIQGFSFFIPVLIPGNKVDVFGSNFSEQTLEDVLETQMTPIFSPMQTLKNFGSNINFKRLDSLEPIMVGELKVTIIDLPHKVNRSLGVKIQGVNGTIVYAPDVLYKKASTCSKIIDFFKGADVLIHDSTSTDHYHQIFSSDFSDDGRDAVIMAGMAGIKRLSLIHYHQNQKDKDLNEMAQSLREFALEQGYDDLDITLAQEGTSLLL
jgi:phosphoribosyl 1,2-cyclic phosphodiesterase